MINNTLKWYPKDLPAIYQSTRHSIWIYCDGSCKNNNNVESTNTIENGIEQNNSNMYKYE